MADNLNPYSTPQHAPSPGLTGWYLKVMRNYAGFQGRARRKEYWMFLLANMLIGFVLGIIQAIAHIPGVLSALYNLVILIPSIAVGVRRMHDSDHSGWWVVVPIVNLVFACVDGTPGENRFGPDPKDPAAAA
jgi:uncharacterized membrane protein YhaH (DUF805 family)